MFSVCGVLISSGSMFTKTAVTVIQAFSYDFFHRNRLGLGAYLTYNGRPGQFLWVLIFHSDPLNLSGLYENAVSVSNTNAIFKNRDVPTNPFISQHLLILDYET